MNIIGKILAGLIFVAALGFLYLAAGTLKTEASWQTRVRDFLVAIEQARHDDELLEFGGPQAQLADYSLDKGLPNFNPENASERPGIEQLKVVLDELVLDRGRIWQGMRGQVTPTGEVSVKIDLSTPHEIKDKTLLYVFEARPAEEGGKYLGEFKVAGVTEQNLALAPAERFTPAEFDQLAQSQPNWVLCEVMPTDRSWAFTGVSDEQLGRMLPESSRGQFLRSGKPSEKTDAPEDVMDGKYVRPLRDYAAVFLQLRKRMAELQDSIITRKSDLARLQATVAGSEAQLKSRDAEIEALKAELGKSTTERDQITVEQKSLAKRVGELEKAAEAILAENKQLAAKWSAAQLEAARKLDQLGRRPLAGTLE